MRRYILLLVEFALSFCILFMDSFDMNYAELFPDLFHSLLNTTFMFVGEIDAWKLFGHCALHEPCDFLVICLPGVDYFTELVTRSGCARYRRDTEEHRHAESWGKIKICIKNANSPGCTPKIHKTKVTHHDRYSVVFKQEEFNWTHWFSIFTTYCH